MKNETYKTLFKMHDTYEAYVNETEKIIRTIVSQLNYTLALLNSDDDMNAFARDYLERIIKEISDNHEKTYTRARNIIAKHQTRLDSIYRKNLHKISPEELEQMMFKHAFKQYESFSDIDSFILNICTDVYSLKNEFGKIFDLEPISKTERECHNLRDVMKDNLTYLNSLQIKANVYKRNQPR